MGVKKIGIDARLYFQTGVGTYVRNLIHYLSQESGNNVVYYVYVLPADAKKIHLPGDRFIKRISPYPWHSWSEQWGFFFQLNADDLDLMHFTYFSYPVLYRKPFIATVHDITPLQFKTGKASTKNVFMYSFKHKIFRYILRTQIKGARFIITPTNTVKKQLERTYGPLVLNKIKTVYEGVGYELLEAQPNMRLQSQFCDPFFMYVGNFYPHKNVERLARVFSNLHIKEKLVLVGPRDFFAEKLEKHISSSDWGKNITFFYQPSFSDIAYLYTHAKALIHPSLSEGFGLPLVEALHFDCPIIASNISVFKELLGDAYQSFSPESDEDMGNAIRSFIQINKHRDCSSLKEKYSFRQMAREIADLYIKMS